LAYAPAGHYFKLRRAPAHPIPNPTPTPTPTLGDWDYDAFSDNSFVQIGFFVYVLLSVVLLLNMLIAMMSSSFEEVRQLFFYLTMWLRALQTTRGRIHVMAVRRPSAIYRPTPLDRAHAHLSSQPTDRPTDRTDQPTD